MDDAQFIELYNRYNGTGLNTAEFAEIAQSSIPTIRRRSRMLGLDRWSQNPRLTRPRRDFSEEYTVPRLKNGERDIEDIKAERIEAFTARHAAAKANQIVDVPIKLRGPIAVWLPGDIHIDDDGCDLPQLYADRQTVIDTRGFFAINIGDSANSWVGRLGRLYGEQDTSEETALRLAEDVIVGVPWLAVLFGNHDIWLGEGRANPFKWMCERAGVLGKNWTVRLNLKFPNKKNVRINAAHDWKGMSMYNVAHGASKIAKTMFQDHIIVGGHIHDFGYNVITHTDSAVSDCGISHCLRVGGYKIHDDYGERIGCPMNTNKPYGVAAVINPDAENERSLVNIFMDIQEAGEYLTWLRNRDS